MGVPPDLSGIKGLVLRKRLSLLFCFTNHANRHNTISKIMNVLSNDILYTPHTLKHNFYYKIIKMNNKTKESTWSRKTTQ